ncbi:hypothetical protein GCM10008018_63340 [Paenibacillus marchantiophytorum]|uniref:DUF2573 family protein n=1 Tax=Paenibacillus marchantiophytorum TaxID=1619310 RepID=A0ABQ1FF76_9BACL|nr:MULTISPECIES: DUF2573 family protein [Paenibacillus]UKS27589.1 YusU family protein [Paenibacillus sp. HWE-109]GGA09025.1 hypothetical protein GCM10008018_63340 [Paenibacillus marchantiophytorum]
MNTDFENAFDSLVAKTAELITGDTSPEMMEKIKIWAFFNHVHKSLPALTSHWNQTHPEGKAEVRRIFEEIRALNQALQANKPDQK